MTVTATASDNVGVASVQFRLDGADVGGLEPQHRTASLEHVVCDERSHTLTAVARDAAGNVKTSLAVAVTVNNADTTACQPSAISAPASGSTVSGSVTVTATASDNVGVASVQFLVNGGEPWLPGYRITLQRRVEHVAL